tara:strand:- start:2081 stop:2707 length:627 start_codon:yes stop_codon:yes gene_type:complete
MANFIYNWQNGHTTSIPLPTDYQATCSNTSPSSKWSSFAGSIIEHAGDSSDLNDVESYLIQGESVIQGKYLQAKQIKDYWDEMEIDCAGWNNWFRWCKDKGRFCYMSENELESAYWIWHPLPSNLLDSITAILQKKADVTAQVYTDLEQTELLAIVQQMIAETNNLISLTAYENDIRELKVTKQKTQDIFTPIMIILIVLGLGFYLYK